MGSPHIRSVEVAEDGLIVMYDDATCAFYHESVLQTHLQARQAQVMAKQNGSVARKPVKSTGSAKVLKWRKKVEE